MSVATPAAVGVQPPVGATESAVRCPWCRHTQPGITPAAFEAIFAHATATHSRLQRCGCKPLTSPGEPRSPSDWQACDEHFRPHLHLIWGWQVANYRAQQPMHQG